MTPRIAEMLRAASPLFTADGMVRVPLPREGRQTAGSLVHEPMVTADDVAAWYWQSDKDVWDLRTDFGPIRPPFDAMWLEWRLPTTKYIGDELFTNLSDKSQNAVSISTGEPGPGTEPQTDRVLAVQPLLSSRQDLLLLPMTLLVEIDIDGMYVTHRILAPETQGVDSPLVESAGDILKIALLSLSFMHCKNIVIGDTALPSRAIRLKAQKRGRPAFLSYKTINLPRPAQESRTLSSARSAVGPGVPLHLVRGHFKTFTPDAPLMGRHTGTYWWAAHARGDVRLGAIGHGYQVGPSAS